MNYLRAIQIILLLAVFSSCNTQEGIKTLLYEQPDYTFPYHLSEPVKTWELPASLVEISGLSYVDDERFACVEDEHGVIYIFNRKTGTVESVIKFGDDGDYEDIQVVGDDAWILKSNGTLYYVAGFIKNPEPEVKEYKTPLSGTNDCEGLAYAPDRVQLLIACKGHPLLERKNRMPFKAVYSFDLVKNQLNESPCILIDLDTIKYYKNYNAITRLGDNIQSFINPSEGDKTFQPSGIAIHPLTGNIYILGSVGKLIIVVSEKGVILAMTDLDPQIFLQPEGICFSPEGILYVSNEGQGKEGSILEFLPKNK